MTRTLDEQIEEYLNGQLSDEETRHFEKNLFKKEVAGAFSETLMIRELLSSLPADEPPPGLIERIEDSLNLGSSPPTEEAKPKRPSSRWGQAVNGFKWGLRWPGYALAGMSNSSIKLKSSLSGMDTIGYSLGPLNQPLRDRINTFSLPKKPLWKIALSKWW
jgi:hypothetical protein